MSNYDGQQTIEAQRIESKAAPVMSRKEFIHLIESGNWHTSRAQRYAKLPHQYIRRSECDPATFEKMAAYIRLHGTVKAFFKRSYIYLEVGEFQYWSMGWPLDETQVINRASKDRNYPPGTKL